MAAGECSLKCSAVTYREACVVSSAVLLQVTQRKYLVTSSYPEKSLNYFSTTAYKDNYLLALLCKLLKNSN